MAETRQQKTLEVVFETAKTDAAKALARLLIRGQITPDELAQTVADLDDSLTIILQRLGIPAVTE